MRGPQINCIAMGIATLASATLLTCGIPASASQGYEARGCLTYTRFDASGKANGKKVMLFQVRCVGEHWLIRTEPAIDDSGGVTFHEASLVSPASSAIVSGFGSATGQASPLSDLRLQVQRLLPEDVNFKNPPVSIPPSISRFLAKAPNTNAGAGPDANGNTRTNRGLIVAEAAVFDSPIPPADSSYVNLLRFAFQPPSANSTNGLLPQVWDDGHPRSVRFRNARWKQFDSSTGLISEAVFQRSGKQLSPEGVLVDLEGRHPDDLAMLEARYIVGSTTNLGGITLPISFTLSRFKAASPSAATEPQRVTTDTALVLALREIEPTAPLSVQLPKPTVVNDYRALKSRPDNLPTVYITENGFVMPLEDLKQSKMFIAPARALGTTPEKPFRNRLLVLGTLLSVALLPPILWIAIHLRNRSKL